jgi:hypothetical protein
MLEGLIYPSRVGCCFCNTYTEERKQKISKITEVLVSYMEYKAYAKVISRGIRVINGPVLGE